MLETDVTVVCLLRLDTTRLPAGVTLNDIPEVIGSEAEMLLGTALQQERFYAVRDYTAVQYAVNRLAESFDEVAGAADKNPPGKLIQLFGGTRASGHP